MRAALLVLLLLSSLALPAASATLSLSKGVFEACVLGTDGRVGACTDCIAFTLAGDSFRVVPGNPVASGPGGCASPDVNVHLLDTYVMFSLP